MDTSVCGGAGLLQRVGRKREPWRTARDKVADNRRRHGSAAASHVAVAGGEQDGGVLGVRPIIGRLSGVDGLTPIPVGHLAGGYVWQYGAGACLQLSALLRAARRIKLRDTGWVLTPAIDRKFLDRLDIRAVPFKKTVQTAIGYLEKVEMDALLSRPDRRTRLGVRDHARLLFLYNSGARADEVAKLTVGISNWARRRPCDSMARENKVRICPLCQRRQSPWPASWLTGTKVTQSFWGGRTIV